VEENAANERLAQGIALAHSVGCGLTDCRFAMGWWRADAI